VQQVILEQCALSRSEQHEFGERMVRLGAELCERAEQGDTIGSFHLGPSSDEMISPSL
jgi:hypothetical protein